MKLIALSLLSLSAPYLIAENTATNEEEPSYWKGRAEVGFVSTSGNTETDSKNGLLNIIYDPEKWRQEFKFEKFKADSKVWDASLNAKTNRVTADKSYFLSKTDYKFNKKSYAYGLADYTDDKFSAFDFVTNLSVGFGQTFIKSKEIELAGEVGYGKRRFYEDEGLVTESRVTEDVFRLAGRFFSKLTPTTKFSQSFSYESGREFDLIKSNSTLNVNINSSIALSMGYEIIHVSDVPETVSLATQRVKTDKKTSINLVFSFK